MMPVTMSKTAALALLLAGAPAIADTEPTTVSSLSEILVTATKREEHIKDIPISVSVVNAKQIDSLGINSTDAVAMLTPGLTFSTQVIYGLPYIRGVGSGLTSLGTESSVALYIDGVYQARQYSLVQNLNNIERIEVLKGPQGELYGRNATGGAINIVTKDPQADLNGSIEATVGNYNEKEEKIYITGGTDMLAGSFAGYLRKHDGYTKNLVTGNRVENENDSGGMFKLKWTVNERNSLGISFDLSDNEGPVGGFASQLGTNNVLASSYPGACYTAAPHLTCADQESRVSVNNWERSRGGAAYWLSEFDAFDLRVTGGIRNIKSESALDVDASSAPIIYFANQGPRGLRVPGENFNMWSVEPVLTSKGNGPFGWLVGGLLYHDNGRVYVTIDQLGVAAQETSDSASTKAYAGYGEGSYKFGGDDRWKATAGVRYSDEKKSIYDASQFLYLGGYATGTATPPTAFPNQEKSWSDVTGSASLTYDFGPANVYGRWSQGFKSGNFNVNSPTSGAVNPEKINAFEVGVKSSLANGRIDLAAAAFYYDYKDLQVQSINSQTGGSFTQNAASAKIEGLESDLRVRITNNLQAQLGISVLDAHYSSFPDASVSAPCANYGVPIALNCTPGTAPVANVAPPNLSGNELVFAPKFGGNASVNYTVPVAFGKFDLASVLNQSGRYFFDPSNRLVQHPYTHVNASLTYHTPSDRWFVRAWSNNLTNRNYLNYVQSVAFGDFGHWADPRTFGLTVGYTIK